MKKFQHRVEYAFVWLIDAFFSALPRPLALKLGESAGVLFSAIVTSRQRMAMNNLRASFPEKKEEELEKITRTMWKSIGRAAAEFVRVSDIKHDNYKDYFVYDGHHHLESALHQGKGVVLVTLHFTNWEMFAVGTCLLLGKGTAIARPMKNPYVEAWIQKKRADAGVQIILHRQAVKASLKILKQKTALGILADHNLYTGGVFVDFFGRPAATTPLPALLHDRTGAPVMVCYSVREGNKFRLVYQPPLHFSKGGTAEERLQKNTQQISHEIEKVVRRRPENWLWIHNRWKRKQGT